MIPMDHATQFRERNILPALVFLRGFRLQNHKLYTVDISAAHSPLNLQPLLQEVSKAFHKGRVSSLLWPAYEKDLSLDGKIGGIRGGSWIGMKGGAQGRA